VSTVQEPVFAPSSQIERLLSGAVTSPLIMGVLNCTPDSFHTGGRSMHAPSAIEHALDLVRQGADIIDVGGESTRPGADRVPAAEQIRRVVPVIQAIRERSGVPLSVDTTLAAVAQAAIEAGAWIVNDVSAGREDPGLFPLVARMGAGLVLMHRLAPPGEDRYSHQYERPPAYGDVVAEVTTFLADRASLAEGAGVPRARMAVDPGFGFGKSVEQNFDMLARLREFTSSGLPVLVGLSRKSFLGAAAGVTDPADRLPASLAAAAQAIRHGAGVLRVHDVAAHVQVRAILQASGGC
jgi:dihydropteroate synthase